MQADPARQLEMCELGKAGSWTRARVAQPHRSSIFSRRLTRPNIVALQLTKQPLRTYGRAPANIGDTYDEREVPDGNALGSTQANEHGTVLFDRRHPPNDRSTGVAERCESRPRGAALAQQLEPESQP